MSGQDAIAALLYLVAGVLFILALKGLSSPVSSRAGNRNGMIGMAIAILTTLWVAGVSDPLTWAMVIGGLAIGGTIGAVMAQHEVNLPDAMRSEEELAQRPGRQVRALVVEEDHLVGRVRSRAVDARRRRFRRQIAVLCEEVGYKRVCDGLEVVDVAHVEATEQHGSVTVQIRVDLVAVNSGPLGECDAVCGRPDRKRKR